MERNPRPEPEDRPAGATVPFLDVENDRVIQIPTSELAPGAVRVQILGQGGLVWALPEHFSASDVQHPPFDGEVKERIRHIQVAFSEHRPLSFQEWEDGFRRDAHPDREIAIWLRAADVYKEFASVEPSPDRRRDLYKCVVACLVTVGDEVWQVLKLDVLTRPEAQPIIDRLR